MWFKKPGRKSEKPGRNLENLKEIWKTWKKFWKNEWQPCYQNMCTQTAYLLKYAYSKCVLIKICVLKMRTYQNMRTQTAYLLKYAYSKCVFNWKCVLKCVPKRKVKVRLNWSKSWKVRLNLQNFAWQPWNITKSSLIWKFVRFF